MNWISEKMQWNSGSSHQQETTYFDDQTTPDFRSLVSEIFDLSSSTKMELENLLSRPMKQGGDCAFLEQRLSTRKKGIMENQLYVTKPRRLWLQFLNDITQSVFTGVPIKGEDGNPLMVALVDAHSGEIVTSGPEASTKLEIVVLEADSDGYLGDSWTHEEFKSKIITKDGNKRLLSGNVVLDLKEGIGFVDIVRFSHTKVWKKKRAYRLGAIAKDDYIGSKTREGFTKSFFVKDHRLDLNKKHYPPTLSDEVWRLDGISRDGAFYRRLSDEKVNINTVGDLLKQLNTNPQKLRDILGKGMSAKMWEVLMNHARTCIIDERLHLYSSPESKQKTCVVFNTVGQVMGLLSEFEYILFEVLSESGKAHAMNLVVTAFQQWDKVISFDDKATLLDNYLRPSNVVYHLKSPMTESSGSAKVMIPPKDDELRLPQATICFDDSNFIHPPNLSTMESFDLSEIIFFSPLIDELDFLRPDVSFDKNVSLFDESPSTSNTICLPKSPIEESSSGPQILFSQKNEDLDFPQPAFSSSDDDASFVEFPRASNISCSSKYPINKISSGCMFLISPVIDELDFPPPVVPSQEIIPTLDSIWEMNYYNDNNWQKIDSTGYSHERHLSNSSEMTRSISWGPESVIRSLWDQNNNFPPKLSGDDIVPKLLPGNPQNDGIGTLVSHTTFASINNARKQYLRNKAKRKWRVISSVMGFVCRNAAGKIPVGPLQLKRSSKYQNLQVLDSEFVIPTFHATKDFQNLSWHTPVLSRNLSMKSEDSLFSTVNDILLARSTPRRYMSKKEKARRRWTKLYSVMRWFSVQRDVTRKDSSSSLNNLSAIWVTDNTGYDFSVSTWDMCLNQQIPISFAGPFREDEYVDMFDTFCSLEPRTCIAMEIGDM